VEITLLPGQQTGWHTHPVPLFGYILEGELTVDYGTKGQRMRLRPPRSRVIREYSNTLNGCCSRRSEKCGSPYPFADDPAGLRLGIEDGIPWGVNDRSLDHAANRVRLTGGSTMLSVATR